MISALTFSDPNFSFDELEPTKHSLKFCKDYIARYFVPLSCGNIAVFKDGKYSVLDDTTVRKVYFNRMPKFDYKTEDGTKIFGLGFGYEDKIVKLTGVTKNGKPPSFQNPLKLTKRPQVLSR